MGIKINKRILLGMFLFCFGFMTSICDAKDIGKDFDKESSQIVRVGIMTNGFKSLERSSVCVYGTSSVTIKEVDSDKEIAQISEGENISFSIEGKQVRCSSKNGNVVSKSSKGFVVSPTNGVLGVRDLKRAGKDAIYRGDFRILPNSKGSALYLINYVELEEYLRGVVPNEMPSKFGVEALKSQAVAARNYAITPRTKVSKSYDVVDSVASQVYFGKNTETSTGDEAIKQTLGIVAMYNHVPILALYSSCAGGYIENYSYAFSDPDTKQFPSPLRAYLMAKPDIQNTKPLNREDEAYEFYSKTPPSYDVKSKYYRWKREWTRTELENVLKTTLVKQSKTGFVKPEFCNNSKLGQLKEIKVIRRGNSGKIIFLDIVTTNGRYRISKELVIRRLFTKDGKALPSANVVFKCGTDNYNDLTTITAFGGGFGHGVGMSQYGAFYMATELKKSFIDILKHYYTGIYLGTVPIEVGEEKVEQFFYPPSKKAVIVLNDRKGLNALQVQINGKTCNFNLGKFYNIQRCELDISSHIKAGKINRIEYTPASQNRRVTTDMSKGPIKIEVYIKFL